jgi:hypothetical protein
MAILDITSVQDKCRMSDRIVFPIVCGSSRHTDCNIQDSCTHSHASRAVYFQRDSPTPMTPLVTDSYKTYSCHNCSTSTIPTCSQILASYSATVSHLLTTPEASHQSQTPAHAWISVRCSQHIINTNNHISHITARCSQQQNPKHRLFAYSSYRCASSPFLRSLSLSKASISTQPSSSQGVPYREQKGPPTEWDTVLISKQTPGRPRQRQCGWLARWVVSPKVTGMSV